MPTETQPPSAPHTLQGEVVEAGHDAEGQSRLIIAVDFADLRDFPVNLVFREVTITLQPSTPTPQP